MKTTRRSLFGIITAAFGAKALPAAVASTPVQVIEDWTAKYVPTILNNFAFGKSVKIAALLSSPKEVNYGNARELAKAVNATLSNACVTISKIGGLGGRGVSGSFSLCGHEEKASYISFELKSFALTAHGHDMNSQKMNTIMVPECFEP